MFKTEKEVPWGPIGYIVFKRTYARRFKEDDSNSPTEEFEDVINRELAASEKQLKVGFTEQEKEEYFHLRHQLKFSVAGRFMWQLGTKTVDKLGLPSLQNCFSLDTEFVTSEGIKRFSDFNDGDKVIIKGSLSWKEATVRNFGKQELVELTVERGKSTKIIKVTKNHRWKIANKNNKLINIKTTQELEPGMVLQNTSLKTNLHNLQICPVGIMHGLTFGDGHYIKTGKCCGFTPCGDSKEEYKKLFNFFGNTQQISGLPSNWKNFPSFDMNKHYIYGFLAGWFAADGSVSKTGTLTLSNASKENLLIARGLFAKLDIYCAEPVLSREINPFNGTPAELWKMTIFRDNLNENFLLLKKHKSRWKYASGLWTVKSISNVVSTENVWCIVEPQNEEFTLSNGILTKNCAFTVIDQPIRPFTWAFEMLMLGSGVGYNIQKEHVYQLPKLKGKVKIERKDVKDADYIVPDTREGWVKLLGKVLKAHFYSGEGFTYSTICIRGKGTPIKGFGGLASGPEELCWGISEITKILNSRANKKLRPIDCLDIMNIIGFVVVSGNVRRSAQIAIGDFDDIEYLKAKRWDLGSIPNWRSMSNNSIASPKDLNDLPNEFWETYNQGEPYGLINLDLSRKVGRTGETQYPDPNVQGYNPCAEQSLENYETCCLGEIFLSNISSFEEFKKCIYYTYRMCKHSLKLPCSLKETENIVHKNMRMGIGITGYLQASDEQKSWLSPGYEYLRKLDEEYSKEHGFPISIKLSTSKPSGTLSLLPGVTPGANPNPAGPYYIRRMRLASNSPLVKTCIDNGYHVEFVKNFDGTEDKTTMVVEFPCKVPETTPVAANFSWKDQIDTIRKIQREWSDNAVSCTVTYKKEDLPAIKEYLIKYFPTEIKSISFLLYHDHGFAQAPYETISKEEYEQKIAFVLPIKSLKTIKDEFEIQECESGACPIK